MRHWKISNHYPVNTLFFLWSFLVDSSKKGLNTGKNRVHVYSL